MPALCSCYYCCRRVWTTWSAHLCFFVLKGNCACCHQLTQHSLVRGFTSCSFLCFLWMLSHSFSPCSLIPLPSHSFSLFLLLPLLLLLQAGRPLRWSQHLIDLCGLTALQQLSQLTSLNLGQLQLQVSKPHRYHATAAVATLTQLKQLHLNARLFSAVEDNIEGVASVQLTAGDVMRLTSLTRLTSL